MAVEFGARSVDHLEASGPAQIAAIAGKPAPLPWFFPGVTLHLGIPAAPGRALIDAGAAVAVGTDLNPGSSPLFSTQVAMALVRPAQWALAERGVHRGDSKLRPTSSVSLIAAGCVPGSARISWCSIPPTGAMSSTPWARSPVERIFIAGHEVMA